MKVITFNVNGIRSMFTKDKHGNKNKKYINDNVICALLTEQQPDVLCLQEIKCTQKDINIADFLNTQALGYKACFVNCAVKAGYSGTCIISKEEPIKVTYGFSGFTDATEFNDEGRVLTVEFEKVIIINVYTPNSKPDLSRLEWRVMKWDRIMSNFVNHLKTTTNKSIILCGDMNVAPGDIDVINPKTAKGAHGFTEAEKQSFASLLESTDTVDAYRYMYPNKVNFTWFSPFVKSRNEHGYRDKGWRIDHFLVSRNIANKIRSVEMLPEYWGSDHIVVMLDIKIT